MKAALAVFAVLVLCACGDSQDCAEKCAELVNTATQALCPVEQDCDSDPLDGEPTDPPPVQSSCPPAGCPSSAFKGIWSGNRYTYSQLPGANPWANYSAVYVDVRKPYLHVSGICPDGSGILDVTGSGTSINWTGALACPWPRSGCENLALTYTAITFYIASNGMYAMDATGTASGCGITSPVTTYFTAETWGPAPY